MYIQHPLLVFLWSSFIFNFKYLYGFIKILNLSDEFQVWNNNRPVSQNMSILLENLPMLFWHVHAYVRQTVKWEWLAFKWGDSAKAISLTLPLCRFFFCLFLLWVFLALLFSLLLVFWSFSFSAFSHSIISHPNTVTEGDFIFTFFILAKWNIHHVKIYTHSTF